LNPVEDEAVVAAALTRFCSAGQDGCKDERPAIELVSLPRMGDFGRPGVSSWKVAEFSTDSIAAKDDDDHDDDDDDAGSLRWLESDASTQHCKQRAHPSTLWPPSSKCVDGLHLDRCFRLWPQDHDSGGFFVALIRKNRGVDDGG